MPRWQNHGRRILIEEYEKNKSIRNTNISECTSYILGKIGDVVMKGGVYKKKPYYKSKKQVKDVAFAKPKVKEEKQKAKGVIKFSIF